MSGFAYTVTKMREKERESVRKNASKKARAVCCQERVTYTKLIQLFAVAVIVR